MAFTIAYYQGNGSTTDFNVPFDYLAKKFVKVTVDFREKLGGDYGDTTKDYFFVDKTTIRFNTAPASGTEIIIRRYTSATDRIVSFKDASVLKAKDLDVSTIQTIHIAEEAREVINDAITGDKEGNWDAKGHRITNVGTPIKDNDAVTLKHYKEDVEGVYQARLNAEKARDAAKVSEANAKASEISASDSALLAKDWAIKLDDTVDGSEYSSKYYANSSDSSAKVASDAETQAKEAEKNATAQAADAKSSAQSAQNSASSASTSAGNAKVSEDKAKASETASKASENASKASEIKSTQEADRAKSEADRAKGYAEQISSGQIQVDWNQTDSTQKDYIKNKPTIPTKTSQLTNDSGFLISSDIKPMLPMGHLFAWPYQTPPDGAIQCNGATYNRALYKDFFAYATSKGWVKTETEWQSIAKVNGGYCPYYSQGDGSTTFRTPKFAPFMQVAIASGDIGKYHKAGLPNIQGRSDLGGIYSSATFSGALTTEYDVGNATGATHVKAGGDQRVKLTFSASNSNSTYGRSSTVQPESHEWMICVVVAGQATNIGSVDVGNVMSAVAQVQASISAIKDKPYITKTWSNGTSWYRKYSDGFIEQSGNMPIARGDTSRTTSFNTPFSSLKSYVVLVQTYQQGASNVMYNNFHVESRTTSSFTGKNACGENIGNSWYACGY